jgi:hypothetical protein
MCIEERKREIEAEGFGGDMKTKGGKGKIK